MNKWERCLIYMLLGISLILSYISICRTCPRTDLGFDYMGVIVGILALLITVLIGWNIYTIIDVKNEIKKMHDLENKVDDKIKYAVSQVKNDVENDIKQNCDNILYHSMYLTFFFQGVTELNKTHGEAAFYYFLEVLSS